MLGALQLRIIALLSAGALAVHELRYLIAYRGSADDALAHQGHEYLSALTPCVAVLLACLLGHLLYRVAWGGEAQRRPSPSRTIAAIGFAAGLLSIYLGQELLEGLLSPGHPGGLHGVFGDGGWLAVPLSGAVGVTLSLGVRGVRAVVDRACARLHFAAPLRCVPPPTMCAGGVRTPAGPPLARHLAGRAPPVAVA